MKKIKTLFVRDPSNRDRVLPEFADGVSIQGALPTRKYDGTSCMISDGVLYKRREVRDGGACPEDFLAVGHENGKTQGWVLCQRKDPADHWHFDAFDEMCETSTLRDGTYELCGPKVQGNPEGLHAHALIPHGCTPLFLGDDLGDDAHSVLNVQSVFDMLSAYLSTAGIEGIVWWLPGCPVAKIKAKDFGFERTHGQV